MNEYKFDVNFEKGKIRTNLKKLVQNDYNSTKINFTFDKEGRKVFKMLLPDGTPYVTNIENNELIFGKGVLSQDGTHEVEISLYTEDGRLTDYATVKFEVRAELIQTDEIIELDDRLPILDTLIQEVTKIKNDAENGAFDGEDGITPTIGENGNWFIGEIDTGLPSRGEKGEKGEAGGVSIEEVKVITGELENLTTEAKGNLVNAINEVASNSGGSSDIVSVNLGSSSIVDSASYTVTYKEQIGKTIVEATENGTRPITLILYGHQEWAILRVAKGGSSGSNDNYGMRGIRCYFQSSLEYSAFSFISLELGINQSTNIVSTYSKKAQYDYKPDKLLTKDNTTAYTPTKDYHPATKKYVDEAITSAIGTALEGSY